VVRIKPMYYVPRMVLHGRRIVVSVVFLALVSCTRPGPEPIAAFLKDRPAATFVFLAPDCPLSQNYVPTLNELRAQFQANQMEIYAVFAGDARPEEFVSSYQLTLPVIKDTAFRIADFFGATTTPEAFVADSKGQVLYKGAIDNRAPELGQQRRVITEHYLLDALNSTLHHTDIAVKETKAVGCFIERTKG
jgi:thiol-disulfide isomerase/thioredoxin